MPDQTTPAAETTAATTARTGAKRTPKAIPASIDAESTCELTERALARLEALAERFSLPEPQMRGTSARNPRPPEPGETHATWQVTTKREARAIVAALEEKRRNQLDGWNLGHFAGENQATNRCGMLIAAQTPAARDAHGVASAVRTTEIYRD